MHNQQPNAAPSQKPHDSTCSPFHDVAAAAPRGRVLTGRSGPGDSPVEPIADGLTVHEFQFDQIAAAGGYLRGSILDEAERGAPITFCLTPADVLEIRKMGERDRLMVDLYVAAKIVAMANSTSVDPLLVKLRRAVTAVEAIDFGCSTQANPIEKGAAQQSSAVEAKRSVLNHESAASATAPRARDIDEVLDEFEHKTKKLLGAFGKAVQL